MSGNTKPRLALLPGEPGGIGPELAVQLAQQPLSASLVCFGDPDWLLSCAVNQRLSLRCHELDIGHLAEPLPSHRPGELLIVPTPYASTPQPGSADPVNAASQFIALEAATDACLRGELDGLITGPLQKSTLNTIQPFTGLTEWLMLRSAADDVVMMLANPDFRVALLTTHLPLALVPAAVSTETLHRRLRILHRALREDFDIAQPRIAVLGLNPHAGEQGLLGREEIEIIIPALDNLRAEGLHLIGPLPADTAFLPRRLHDVDAVFAMYHDQGLPVLKFSGFEKAVNISLGLPFVRVAVDHGTALDLAGSGRADASSMVAAAQTAISMCSRRRYARSQQ